MRRRKYRRVSAVSPLHVFPPFFQFSKLTSLPLPLLLLLLLLLLDADVERCTLYRCIVSVLVRIVLLLSVPVYRDRRDAPPMRHSAVGEMGKRALFQPRSPDGFSPYIPTTFSDYIDFGGRTCTRKTWTLKISYEGVG